MRLWSNKPFRWMLLVSLFFASIPVVMGGTPFAFSDSRGYLSMAENVLLGHGFRATHHLWNIPTEIVYSFEMRHFPPGYPILLMLMKVAGLNIRGEALLIVNALLLALTYYFTGALVYFFTRRLAWALFAILLVVTSYVPYGFLMAISEPLFADQEIIRAAARRRIKVISPDDFSTQLGATPVPDKEVSEPHLTPDEVEAWLRLFGGEPGDDSAS